MYSYFAPISISRDNPIRSLAHFELHKMVLISLHQPTTPSKRERDHARKKHTHTQTRMSIWRIFFNDNFHSFSYFASFTFVWLHLITSQQMNLITNLYEFRHRWSGNNIENPFCIRPNPATTIDASEVKKNFHNRINFVSKTTQPAAHLTR